MLIEIKNGPYVGQQIQLESAIIKVSHYTPPVSVGPLPIIYMTDTPLLQFPLGSDMPSWVNAGDFFEVEIIPTILLN
jgi:hypothetical protein